MNMSVDDSFQQIQIARRFVKGVIEHYWDKVANGRRPIQPVDNFLEASNLELNNYEQQETLSVATSILGLSMLEASFRIGEIYTQKLPKALRAQHGVYFTPPALSNRLLDNIEQMGFDWGEGKIVDPACGGGAFLAPIALRMKRTLKNKGYSERDVVEHVAYNLKGKELDPFSAWMSQVFLEIALLDELTTSGYQLPIVIDVTDTLTCESDERYDLVVGNPPYSKIKLNDEMRKKFSRSLYGHANLYGLFTDKALSMLTDRGVLAYVTPSSFLSGQYFKALRKLLSLESSPVCIDFIESRKGVFSDVLQETVLAVFSKQRECKSGVSSTLRVLSESNIEVEENGEFIINADNDNPWLIPRNSSHSKLLVEAQTNHATLASYGYKVSTGPLVWNRHKDQIVSHKTKTTLPLLWGECISPSGKFEHKSDKKNHAPWFKIESEKDNWLIVREPCLLLQRTTAKEQASRLIGAIIPIEFIDSFGGVVIENHINMVKPIPGAEAAITLEALQLILKSRVIDTLFRMMNGSVAVSAYELEALPLPPLRKAIEIQEALVEGVDNETIQTMIKDSYSERITEAA